MIRPTSIKLKPEINKRLNKLIEMGVYDSRSHAINLVLEDQLILPENLEEVIEDILRWNNYGK